MFKFLKKNKLIAFLMTASTIALTAVVVSTVSWYSVQMQITPDVDSGIRLSYFDESSGDGSEGHPYIITRPVHYYNLVRLMEMDYEGFNGNNTYFEFGKDFDSSGTYKFYNYNEYGVQQSGYSTSLNMDYYAGDKALSPLGSANYPFLGNIEGHNLTVSNLHITGKGRTDIGVFGYVGAGASVSNLYFSTVDIDLNVTDVSEVNGTGHTAHSTHTTFGYIAGHVHDNNSFDNVYINKSSVRNSGAALPSAVKNNFGYFGYCDTVELPNIGEEAYKQSFDPGDVYDYLDANYDSISGHSLVTRNTEYQASGNLSTAITDNSNHYTFNSANSKNYSLATAGYQEQEHTYIAQYKNGNSYNMMTGASVTQTAPANQENEGAYVYYDSTNNKWTYYTAVEEGGSSVTNHFNVYTISYNAWDDDEVTYYLYNNTSTNQLDYTTTEPGSYAETPQYYFAFCSTKGSAGVTPITDGTSSSYYIYSPSTDKYLCAVTGRDTGTEGRTPLYFGDISFINGSSYWTINNEDIYCVQSQFGIQGSSLTAISLSYNDIDCKLVGYNQSGHFNQPYYGEVNGNRPTLYFTLNGDSESSGESDPVVTYSFVKTTSSWVPAANDVISIVYENGASSRALSKTQSTNNRPGEAIQINNDEFVPGGDVAWIQLETGGESGKFYLHDISPSQSSSNAYLHCASGDSSNHLISSSSPSNNSTYNFTVTYNSVTAGATRGHLRWNSTNSLFACYKSGQNDIVVYLRRSTSTTIHYEGAYDVSETVEGEGEIVTTSYDVYYYDEDVLPISREQLTTTFISSWSLKGNTTYVTIAPEIINGWNLVENQSDLKVGEKYAIAVYQDGSGNNVLKTAGTINLSDGYLSGITSTFNVDGSQITSLGEGTYQFVLSGNSTNGYSLSCSDGQLFADQANTKLSFANGIGLWDITISSGTATITAKTTSQSIKYNSSGTRFKTYASGQTSIRLYRYDTTAPKYIGDKIGNGYNPSTIDTVGNVDYYSSYMRMNGSTTRLITEGSDLNQTFYNTKYTSKSLVIRIPNRGSIDYGTLVIDCGNTAPVLMKNNSTSVSLSDVGVTAKEEDNKYHLYLNKYNIYQLCYCTLNSSGQINGCYDTDGDEIFTSGAISEFVLILGAPSATNVDINHLDIVFSAIKGNLGDFGRVGFRDSPDTVPGEIISFTYDLPAGGYVYSEVKYTYDEDLDKYVYDLYFKSTSALTLYVYNYDANRAIVRVNGTRKYGPYNEVSITSSSSPGTSGWTSYS